MVDGRFELVMEPTAIGLVSLDSISEAHINARCNAMLSYGRVDFTGIYMLCSFKAVILFMMIILRNLMLRTVP